MKKIDLSWGESVVVRHAFRETLGGAQLMFDSDSIDNMGYPPHEGDPDLIELTKYIIKRNINREYKYVLITNGATGGVTVALRTYKLLGRKQCLTDDPPYFRLYPDMIRCSGLNHLHRSDGLITNNQVYLVDSPSNPLGKFTQQKRDLYRNSIIWDTVYFNKVYSPGNYPQPEHDVLVGSYSKLLGLNGLRIGWIATNDSLLYEALKITVTAEYCGISSPSTKIILETAGKFSNWHWDSFETNANFRLDWNRMQWSRLEKYFGNKSVLPVGMFYYAPIDKACKKLLEKSNINWSPGSHLGTTDDFGRFNMGQDSKLIQRAVKEVLKNDKI